MTIYEQQLTNWSEALSAGRGEAVLRDLTDDCGPRDVERFLANAIGERSRLLKEELDLVSLAFDDFDALVQNYLSETPRQAFQLYQRDQQRFLDWLKDRNLTPQQRDFVTCQEAEYACHEQARRHRAAHCEFQRLLNESRQRAETIDRDFDGLLLVNPVHVWAYLNVAAAADNPSRDENALFFTIDMQIHSLWLTQTKALAVRNLIAHSPVTSIAWRAACPFLPVENHVALCRELVQEGLAALC